MLGGARVGIAGIRLIGGANQALGVKTFGTAIAGSTGVAGIAVTDFLCPFHAALAVDTRVGITGMVGQTIAVVQVITLLALIA